MSPPVSREPSHRGLDDSKLFLSLLLTTHHQISRQILTFSMARLFPLALLVILANLTLSSGMSLSGYLERRASVGKLIGHPGLYEDSQPVAKTFERPERTVDTTGGVSSVKRGIYNKCHYACIVIKTLRSYNTRKKTQKKNQ
ncbi:uncharacterized protein LOC112565070 isoform X2 [Pomacea canaliculata]|uniref:uncharacterized protein LOC112565070 isoform X2 n=1 Tax=Pomacea canaliculata TaxID=400727 RepID=UPI000D72BE3E|nr:uncharacterized protein LOC112565070 isoform X2 [Pomacea canaliculata]